MCWVEGDLFDLGKVVGDVAVEFNLAERVERELVTRPDLGEVIDVDTGVGSICGVHDLILDVPLGEVSLFDGFEEILLVSIGRLLSCLVVGEVLGALLGEKVDLTVFPLALLVDELDRVPRVALHVSPRERNTTRTHEVEELVDGLGVVTHVVPEVDRVVGMRQVRLRVSLLRVDKVRELGRITKEEDRSVVEHPIHVSLCRPHLDGKSTRITSAIRRTRFATNSREANSDRTFSLFTKEWRKTDVRNWVGGSVDTVSSTTLSVNDSLRDTFAIEVRDQVDKVKVLKQKGAFATGSLGFIGMRDSDTIGSGVSAGFRVAVLLERSDGESSSSRRHD